MLVGGAVDGARKRIFLSRVGGLQGSTGPWPRRLRPCGCEASGTRSPDRKGCREADADADGPFDDAGGDLDQGAGAQW
jgi:hypothetical protein